MRLALILGGGSAWVEVGWGGGREEKRVETKKI